MNWIDRTNGMVNSHSEPRTSEGKKTGTVVVVVVVVEEQEEEERQVGSGGGGAGRDRGQGDKDSMCGQGPRFGFWRVRAARDGSRGLSSARNGRGEGEGRVPVDYLGRYPLDVARWY